MKLVEKILVVIMISMIMCWSMSGCKSRDKAPKHRTLHGTIAKIDTSDNTVAMNWFNEKEGKTIPVAGKITPETEIYIDGKLADINQLKENDEVSVEGYKKGTDVVAVKVMVARNSNVSQKIQKPAAATQPAVAQ